MQRRTREEVGKLTVEAIEMIQAGLPAAQAARELGVSTAYLYRLLEDAGFRKEPDPPGGGLDEELLKGALEAYYDGNVPLLDILRGLGISHNTFYAILVSRGLQPRRRTSLIDQARQARLDTAVQLYYEGAAYAAIYAETGVDQPQLGKELHRRGTPPNRRKRSEYDRDPVP